MSCTGPGGAGNTGGACAPGAEAGGLEEISPGPGGRRNCNLLTGGADEASGGCAAGLEGCVGGISPLSSPSSLGVWVCLGAETKQTNE